MLFIKIYLIGMFLGFLEAAREKGKDWNETDSSWVPYFLTFGWPLPLLVFIAFHTVNLYKRCPNLFFWLLDKTSNAMRWRPKPSQRKKITAPFPAVRQEYRQPGPHPCIACGTPTSLDQSDMECVESVEKDEDAGNLCTLLDI